VSQGERVEPSTEPPRPLDAAWGEAVALMIDPLAPAPAPAPHAPAQMDGLKGLAAREAFLAYLSAPAPMHAPAPSPAVSHPAHYHPGAYEAIEVIAAWGLDFWSGNALKYIARAGRKAGAPARQDIEKALWYVRDARQRQRHDLSAPRYVEAGAAFGRFAPARVAEVWGLPDGALCGALYALASGALDDAEEALREHLDDGAEG